jgi:hypothetical protein
MQFELEIIFFQQIKINKTYISIGYIFICTIVNGSIISCIVVCRIVYVDDGRCFGSCCTGIGVIEIRLILTDLLQ